MASKLANATCISLLLFCFFSPSLCGLLSTIFNSTDTICNFTPHPDFCKSVLSHNMSGTITNYSRIILDQTMTQEEKIISIVQQSLRKTPALALQDCQLLAGLNQDFLYSGYEIIDSAEDHNLDTIQIDEVQSLLSAAMTNQQTCLDSLQESSSSATAKDALIPVLTNGMKLYSLCLALFTKGWVDQTKTQRLLREVREEKKLSNFTQGVDVSANVTGRKLLQSVGDNVLVSQMVVVNPDGSGNFTTINDAVAAAPNKTNAANGYHVIYVVAGVYEEYVIIPKTKTNLMMIGDGIGRTVITGNRSVVDGWTTFSSATFSVVGKEFVAVNMTFRNTAGAIKHQAVAVRNGADMSSFYRCSFEGYQDTLYTHSLRQFYKACDIYGTVDFIFGNAAVVFQNCNIYPRLPMQNQFNAITAQGRIDPNQNTGISIQYCTIKAANDLRYSDGATETYLGRPWKEYSRTVYMQSYIDGLVDTCGWMEWSGDVGLSTLYYAEYGNQGPGSDTSKRVTWPGYHLINATEAAEYTVSSFITGQHWLPTTGVPFTGGL